MPDFLGPAVHRTGESCYRSLVENDAQLFAKLFPPYFIGILAVIERVRPRVARYHAQQAVTSMAEPLLDLLDIAGYAMIYGELHGGPELWQTARRLFDRYFAPPEGVDRMKLVAAMYEHRRTSLGLPARSILRHRWQKSLSDQLSSLPRKAGSDVFDPGEVDHGSALIRRLAPDPDPIGSLHFDASDILVVRYLAKLPGATGLNFGVADWVRREMRELDDPDEKGETS